MWKKIASLATAVSFAVFAPAVTAQPNTATSGYPGKPLRFMAGFPPGGVADIVARIIAPPLSQRLGQPVVVDNRAGAGGVIGADAVAKSAPDGYTIGFGVSGALTANVTLMPKLPYDPLKDLASVSKVVNNPLALVVSTSLGVNSVKEFITLAKLKPGQLTYGTAGHGTAMNLAGELLNQMAGIDLRHVPYKGSNPAAVDLLAGHIQAAVLDLATAKSHLESGRLKALAITTAKRTAIAPELPTMAEAGVPGYELGSWFGLIMPAGTPPGIIKRINAELTGVLNDPKVREQLLAAKTEPMPSTPEEMRNTIRKEIQQTAALIKAANIKLD
jgi:tripartite-type tricarboxylate transporter receptor subunit TctC